MEATITRDKNIAEDLRRIVSSKVLDDSQSITAYSIDASIYKIVPQAIVLLDNENDIPVRLKYSQVNIIPRTGRAGGSNLTGNAVGEGIILDFSKMNKVLSVDIETKSSFVECGISLHEYQRELEKYQLMYGPDPSSGDMCKLGGMFGNNSAGPHTLKYGAVKDNVLELDVFLYTGNKINAKEYIVGSNEYKNLLTENPSIAELVSLVEKNKEIITKKRLGVSKNSSGYNLQALAEGLDRGVLDLTKIFIGSEGTLGLITKSKLPLFDKPKKTVTMLMYFTDLQEIGDAVKDLLKHKPSAVEIMDNNTLNLLGRNKFGIPFDAKATLIVEFDEEPFEPKVEDVKTLSQKYKMSGEIAIAYDKEAQDNLWKTRKAIYPTLYKYGNNKKPINFCDDVVVSAEYLPQLIKYLDDIFKEYNVPV
ncbi:MAG: FAD-binding oxidoreductase, partial [Candidatus Sericytochromatia bacterium]